MARKGSMPKLAPQPVPEPLWHISAYRLLDRRIWERIRSDVVAGANGSCAVCEVVRERGAVCHEVWRYSERRGIATLAELRLICGLCNLVEHIGFTSIRLPDKTEEALRHMARVNGHDLKTTQVLVDRAFKSWSRRSKLRWKTDVSPSLLSRFPDLKTVAGRDGVPGAGARRVRDAAGR